MAGDRRATGAVGLDGVGDDPPVGHADAAACLGGDARVVGHKHDRLGMIDDERAQQFDDPARVLGIEGSGRLVGEDDRRRGDQRPRDRSALLLTAGEGIGTVVGAVPHADGLEGGAGGRVTAGLGDAVEHQRQADILDERQFGKQVVALEDEADPAPPDQRQVIVAEGRQVDSLEEHLPGGRPGDATEKVEERALSRPRGPGDGHELPWLDLDIDTTDRLHTGRRSGGGEALLEVFGAEDRHGVTSLGSGTAWREGGAEVIWGTGRSMYPNPQRAVIPNRPTVPVRFSPAIRQRVTILPDVPPADRFAPITHLDSVMSPRTRCSPPVAILVALASGFPLAAAEETNWPRPPGAPMQLPSSEVPLAVAPDDGLVDGLPMEGTVPTPRTLEEFVALAERSHPRMLAARAAVEATRGKAVQARLYPNPVIAGFSPQIAGPESQWSGTVAQDIVTGGKLRLQQQAALRDIQRAEYELIRARFDVLRGVRQSYYQLLVAQRRIEIYKLLLDIAKRSYEIGRQLAEAGEGTKADVLFWSIERDRAEVRILNATVFIETGRRELAAAIGLPRVDIERLEADLFQELPNFDLKELQEAVVRSNALPRAAEARIAGNQWALERAVVQPIPNVNLMGGYQRQVGIPAQDQGLAQVMMSVPLFDRNQGNIRAARADIATARADLRMVELDLATQTAQAVAAYRTSQRLVDWYEEYILPKARETVTLTQTLYARGEVTFLSLLQAQKILTETELAYVDAQAERWNGAVAIADLLQLEQFPPRADAPAAQPMGEPMARPEEVPAPAAKKPDGAAKPTDKPQPAAAPAATPAAPPGSNPPSPVGRPAVPPAKDVPPPQPTAPAAAGIPPGGQGEMPLTATNPLSSAAVTLVGGVREASGPDASPRAQDPAGASQQPPKRRGLMALIPDAYLPGRGAAPRR